MDCAGPPVPLVYTLEPGPRFATSLGREIYNAPLPVPAHSLVGVSPRARAGHSKHAAVRLRKPGTVSVEVAAAVGMTGARIDGCDFHQVTSLKSLAPTRYIYAVQARYTSP